MDHTEAVRTKAAECYLLGEMTQAAREEYEEHFFGCVECAQDVQTAATFIDATRDVLGSERASASPAMPERKPSFWAWILRPAFAIPAMALMLFAISYQNLRTIPQMRSELKLANSAQAPQMFSLLGANSRGGVTSEIAVSRDKAFGLYVDIPPSAQYSSYSLEIDSESGSTGLSADLSAEQAKETVPFLVPSSRLASGKYSLVVRGYDPQKSRATEVVRYPFILKITN